MGDLVLMLGTHVSGWPCAEVTVCFKVALGTSYDWVAYGYEWVALC